VLLYTQLRNHRIILGSKSPRRQYFLREMGIEFRVAVPDDIDELYPAGLKGEEIPVYLAKLKSSHLQNYLNEETILITADTIVWLDDEVLGKPGERKEAVRILKKLSGRKHEVYSGVCIRSAHKELTFSDKTNVYFKSLSDQEIDYYLDNYKPYDKAGAYGAQEWIGFIAIEKIEGSYFNVMGFPVHKLYNALNDFVISDTAYFPGNVSFPDA